jgi:iron complex transport system substrate-binding protein
MEKKQFLIIAVALIVVAGAAIGIMWYAGQDGKEAGDKTGILLSYENGAFEWAAMDTRSLTAAEAYHKARGSSAAPNDGGDWSFLWTISGNDTDWKKNTGGWDHILVTDFKYIAFSEKDEKPPLFTDSTGEFLFHIIGPKNRIVSLSPSITDLVIEAGAKDKIIGADDDSAKELGGSVIMVGGFHTGPNFEKIISAKPDLVIADQNIENQVALIANLKAAGINVLVISKSDSIESICNNLIAVGYATGNIVTAQEKADNIKTVSKELSLLGTNPKNVVPGTQVMIIMPYNYGGRYSYYIAGSEEEAAFISSILNDVGGANVFNGTLGWQQLNNETLFTAQPDIVLVLLGMDYVSNESKYALESDSMLRELSAVKEGHVYSFGGKAADTMARPGPNIIHAMAMIYLVLAMDEDDWKDGAWGEFGNDYMNDLQNALPHLFP